MKKKKLRKKLASQIAYLICHNEVLTKENESLAAEIQKMERLFSHRTTEYAEAIKNLRNENKSLLQHKEACARLKSEIIELRAKLYGGNVH